MKYTIFKIIGTYDKSKQGVPFVTKNGKPYKKSTVNFTEDPTKLVTVMVWQGNEIKVGDVVEGDITEREWNGNKYYDFKQATKPNKIAQLEYSVAHLQFKVNQIVDFLKEKYPSANLVGITSAGTPVPTFKPNTPEQAKDFDKKMTAYENEVFSNTITPEEIPF